MEDNKDYLEVLKLVTQLMQRVDQLSNENHNLRKDLHIVWNSHSNLSKTVQVLESNLKDITKKGF